MNTRNVTTRLLLFTAWVLCGNLAYAQLVYYEGFDDSAAPGGSEAWELGNVQIANPPKGTTFSIGPSAGNTGLAYTSLGGDALLTTAGHLEMGDSAGGPPDVLFDPNPTIDPGGLTAAGKEYYLSYLLQAPADAGGAQRFWSPNPLANFALGVGNNATEFRILADGVADLPESNLFTGVSAYDGQTHLLVARIKRQDPSEEVTGDASQIDLWIDPVSFSSLGTPNATALFAADGDTLTDLQAASGYFRTQVGSGPSRQFDELRIGASLADVLPKDPNAPTGLAVYLLGSAGTDSTNRTSSDAEPLTSAGSITGAASALGDAGGLLIDGDVFNATNSSDAFTAGNVLEFTIGIDQADSMSIDSLNFRINLEAAESVFNYAIRSSLDGFSSDLVDATFANSPGLNTVSEDLSGVAALQGLTSDVTFQVALYGAFPDNGSGNNATISALTVLGDVTGDLPGLPGDYNNDGVVNLADYTVWRDNLGASDETALNGNGDGGGITVSDYTYWKSRFGDSNMSAVAEVTAGQVPEPQTLALLALAALTATCFYRSRSSYA